MIAEKSAISFVTILVLLLVLRNSKLPLTMSLICLCNCIRFVVEVSTMGDSLPDLLDECCCGLCWACRLSRPRGYARPPFLMSSGKKEIPCRQLALKSHPRIPQSRCRHDCYIRSFGLFFWEGGDSLASLLLTIFLG